MMTKDKKTQLIQDFKQKDGDTGSPEVQIALVTERIKYLTDHFKTHPKAAHLPAWPFEISRTKAPASRLFKKERCQALRVALGPPGPSQIKQKAFEPS